MSYRLAVLAFALVLLAGCSGSGRSGDSSIKRTWANKAEYRKKQLDRSTERPDTRIWAEHAEYRREHLARIAFWQAVSDDRSIDPAQQLRMVDPKLAEDDWRTKRYLPALKKLDLLDPPGDHLIIADLGWGGRPPDSYIIIQRQDADTWIASERPATGLARQDRHNIPIPTYQIRSLFRWLHDRSFFDLPEHLLAGVMVSYRGPTYISAGWNQLRHRVVDETAYRNPEPDELRKQVIDLMYQGFREMRKRIRQQAEQDRQASSQGEGATTAAPLPATP